MGKLKRREFLRLAATGVGSMVFGQFSGAGNTAEAAEGEPVPRAIGKFIDRSTGQVYGDELPILGVDGYYYIVATKNGARYYSIESIQTLNRDHFPFETIVQDERLGFRSDDIRFAHMLPRTGGRIDRIAFPSEDLLSGTYFDNAITAAQAAGMRVIVVFNPAWPRDADYYKARIDYCLSKGVIVELGNEPDNKTPGYEFWEGQNFDTFAAFIKICQDYIYQRDPNYQPILGALVDVSLTDKYLTALATAGVNIGHLRYGVHAYQSSEDLPNRLWTMGRAFKKFGINPTVDCTELGAQYPYLQKGVLLEMIKRAYQTNVASIVIHQLFDNPEGGQPYGFGVVSPDWTITYPIFMQINAFVRLLAAGYQPQTIQPTARPRTATPTATKPTAAPTKVPTPKPKATRSDRD